MTWYQMLIPQLFGYAVILAVLLRVIRTARRDGAAHRAEHERTMAEFARLRAGRAAPPAPPAAVDLIVHLDLSDEDAMPELRAVAEQAGPLVRALSRHEQALGGAGLTLTAAKVERGTVRLTLSPVDRVGSGERVRRIAEQINADQPAPDLAALPPGVTSASAGVLAA
ncbi:MAG: hypothetical protein K2P78_02555 [Gemmataceae bacterium]|nr:hypothetical protein [Gemmataceae bacterium]